MIYFAQLPTGSIKIGFSDNVPARMEQLARHYGTEPAVLYVMEGDREVERAIHDRFASHRLGRTEQFRAVPEIMAFIGCPLLVSPNAEAVEAVGPHFKPVRLDLTPDEHKALRRAAAEADMSMTALAKRLVVEAVMPKKPAK